MNSKTMESPARRTTRLPDESTLDFSIDSSTNRFGKRGSPVKFKGSSLRYIEIPSDVKVIDESAFRECEWLEEVELHDGLEQKQKDAFLSCTSLKGIRVPRTVKAIAKAAVIGAQAFRNCTQLECVQLVKGPDHVQNGAFDCSNSPKRIKILSTVKMIEERAFSGCTQLRTVTLCEGLEHLGRMAFEGCKSLQRIFIPSNIPTIHDRVFYGCKALMQIALNEGLGCIGNDSFASCTSLEQITISSTVTVIGVKALSGCKRLEEVNLANGLKKISDEAFASCRSLKHIDIPSTVKEIHPRSFLQCSHLVAVTFCDEIEEFVSGESLRGWWNNGISEESLKTYNFLARYNVPVRLGMLTVTKWHANIHNMLECIPSIIINDLDDYFHSIESMLKNYEWLQDTLPLLELAIWKSKLSEHFDPNNGNLSTNTKLERRNTCGASVIIPIVQSFLMEV
jgi:hypothetical protein